MYNWYKIVVFCSMLPVGLPAQEVKVKDRYNEFFGTKPALYLSVRSDLNADDASVGAAFGGINSKRNLTGFVSFDVRPYRKRALSYAGNNLYYQYREDRFFIGAGAEYIKMFRDSNFGGVVQLSGAYSWGSYGGTEQKPDKGFLLMPRMAVLWRFWGYQSVSIGYSYIDAKSRDIDKNRVFVAFNYVFSKKR